MEPPHSSGLTPRWPGPEGTGAVGSEEHGRARHGRTRAAPGLPALRPPPGLHRSGAAARGLRWAGRPGRAAPPARGRAGPSADRPRRGARLVPPQFSPSPRQRCSPADLQPDSAASRRPASLFPFLPPSPSPAMLPHLALLLLASGAARALEVSGAGAGREGASPPSSSASPRLCLPAAPVAWGRPRRGGRVGVAGARHAAGHSGEILARLQSPSRRRTIGPLPPSRATRRRTVGSSQGGRPRSRHACPRRAAGTVPAAAADSLRGSGCRRRGISPLTSAAACGTVWRGGGRWRGSAGRGGGAASRRAGHGGEG